MQVMEQVLSTDESTQLMEQDLSIDNAELPQELRQVLELRQELRQVMALLQGGPELRPELLGVFPELRPELLRVFPELRPELPAVLAISNLISDGFTFRTYGESQYRYLGVRKARNYTTTGVIRSLTKHSIAIAFVDEWRRNAILKTADLLGLPEPSVRFTALAPPGSSEDRGPRFDVFSKGLDGVKLAKSEIRSAYGELLGLTDGNKHLSPIEQLTQFAQVARSIKFDRLELLRLAKKSGIMDADVSFGPESDLNYDRLSTGQLLFLSMVARIVAFVTPGSVVLVDDPETALHPTRQSQLLPLLRDIIPAGYGCHLFFATHSPHIVSDGSDLVLPGERWGSFIEYRDPFYGRDLETLLYRAFGARTTGNSLVEDDLVLLASAIASGPIDQAESETLESIRGAFYRLKEISGDDTPVVKEILEAAASEFRLPS